MSDKQNFISPKNLAEELGVQPGAITYHIQKGNLDVVKSGNRNLIDKNNPKNKLRIAQIANSKVNRTVDYVQPGEIYEEVNREMEEKKRREREKQELDIELKREQLEEARLKKRKLQGEAIPVSLVSSLFATLGRSFQGNYRSKSENLLNELIHRAKIDPAIAAEFKSRLLDEINKAHEASITAVQNGLKKLIDEQRGQ